METWLKSSWSLLSKTKAVVIGTLSNGKVTEKYFYSFIISDHIKAFHWSIHLFSLPTVLFRNNCASIIQTQSALTIQHHLHPPQFSPWISIYLCHYELGTTPVLFSHVLFSSVLCGSIFIIFYCIFHVINSPVVMCFVMPSNRKRHYWKFVLKCHLNSSLSIDFHTTFIPLALWHRHGIAVLWQTAWLG